VLARDLLDDGVGTQACNAALLFNNVCFTLSHCNLEAIFLKLQGVHL
jgi:hypothetical protein